MKDKVILACIVLALLSLVIAFIGKFSGHTILFTNHAWHMFSQTCLLLGIAWGIGKYLEAEKKV